MEKNKISLNYVVCLISIIYVISSSILTNFFKIQSSFFLYSDEIVTLVSVILMVILGLRRKIIFKEDDIKNLKLLLIVILIGILSNVIYKVQNSLSAILIDICGNLKIFLVFNAFKVLLSKKDCDKIFKTLFVPAKLILISATLCGIISLFYDIGMSRW